MLSIQLSVSTEQMKAASDSVENRLSTMKTVFDELDTIVKRTSSYWEGEGAEHYRGLYEGYRNDITEIIARLNEQINDLRIMAGIYEQAEAGASSISTGLPDDVIF